MDDDDYKRGFEVGWDFACYGLTRPPYADDGGRIAAVQAGHDAASYAGKYGMLSKNRYIIKWLMLRYSSFKRRKEFDPGVTPDYVRRIFTAVCPITSVRLGFTRGDGTDWSIDRLDNNRGYVRGNLICISTHANFAKDRVTVEDIARADWGKPIPGLSLQETLRLYTLLIMDRDDVGFVRPIVAPPPLLNVAERTRYAWLATELAVVSLGRQDVYSEIKAIERTGTKNFGWFFRHLRESVKRAAQVAHEDGNAAAPLYVTVQEGEAAWATDSSNAENFLAWYERRTPLVRASVFDRLQRLRGRRLMEWHDLPTANIEPVLKALGYDDDFVKTELDWRKAVALKTSTH